MTSEWPSIAQKYYHRWHEVGPLSFRKRLYQWHRIGPPPDAAGGQLMAQSRSKAVLPIASS
jgi:hypothetical protein